MFHGSMIDRYVDVEEDLDEDQDELGAATLNDEKAKNATDPIIYSINLKPFSWREAYEILIDVDQEKVSYVRPYRPAAGRLYVYDTTTDSFLKKEWRLDGYTWDSTYGGANVYPGNKPESLVKKLLWPLFKADRRFLRYEWQLTENGKNSMHLPVSYVLVHYVGDESVYRPDLHNASKLLAKPRQSGESVLSMVRTPSLIASSSLSRKLPKLNSSSTCLGKRKTADKIEDIKCQVDDDYSSTDSRGMSHSYEHEHHAGGYYSETSVLTNVDFAQQPSSSSCPSKKVVVQPKSNANAKHCERSECELRMRLLLEESELKKELLKRKIEAADAEKYYYEILAQKVSSSCSGNGLCG